MLAKKILNSIGIVSVARFFYSLWLPVARYVYWLWLEFDARTMAEMPQVMYSARKKADKYRPF